MFGFGKSKENIMGKLPFNEQQVKTLRKENLKEFENVVKGMGEDAAVEFIKSAEALAVANGVVPGIVLDDIAQNAEMFANFAGEGSQNMIEAAISASSSDVRERFV